ncbi:MAG TPA: isochorismatase family cysteine hydrolase [Erysipelotrichaceae bacterium]|nr:isochorismatase family cysteine hydrolase [Erysipelotrichaceae bacterium]
MENKIIIIDMVNGFVKEGPLHDKSILDIVDNINTVVEKVAGDIIVFEDCHHPDSKEFEAFPPHCLAGDSQSETIDELSYLFNHPNYLCTIKKNSTNGIFQFIGRELAKPGRYYIMGVCSDICILQFAMSLKALANEMNMEMEIVVVSDAIDTFDGIDHDKREMNELALNLMRSMGIQTITSAEV